VTNKLFRDARSSFVRAAARREARQSSPAVDHRQVTSTSGSTESVVQRPEHSAAGAIHQCILRKLNAVKTTITSRLASASHSSDVFPSPDPPQTVMSNFDPVFLMEVERLINRLQPKTSPLEVVPVSVLKHCKAQLAVAIVHLANLSFSTGQFPVTLKIGWVTPRLEKAGLDTADFKNFRPITNLSTTSKIIERLALNRMRRCITESPNYGKLQSAYRQGHSTETARGKIMDDIIKTVDGGWVVALASLDISAAFDAVDHDVLVRRLEDEFGITGTCSRWIQSYLTGRTTVVQVGQSSSAAAAVQLGVPRGSVLGPILYTA
jgi:Reverse transcriptase (RNA-dependent DNA polymerase)